MPDTYETAEDIDKEIKSTKRKMICVITIIVVILLGVPSYFIYTFFFSMSSLPEGKMIAKSDSPTGNYTIRIYLSNGGATTSFAIRGEIENNKTGSRKNIFWQYKKGHATVRWKNNDIVIVNGIALDVRKDKYDYRSK